MDGHVRLGWIHDVTGGVPDHAAAVFNIHEPAVAPVRAPRVL